MILNNYVMRGDNSPLEQRILDTYAGKQLYKVNYLFFQLSKPSRCYPKAFLAKII